MRLRITVKEPVEPGGKNTTMPAYQTTPFKAMPKLLVAGTPEYLFGSYNDKTGPTLGFVISDSAVTTTGTVTFQITSGNIPVVGAKITVVGTANASGNFNVTNGTILTVTTTNSGVCTVTYAITSSTVAANTADNGQVSIPQVETGETLANGASIPASMPYNNVNANLNQALTAVATFPSLPTAAVITLQQAVFDIDAEYANIATVATVSGGVVTASGSQITVDPTLGRFFRFNVTGVSGGTAPTVAAKLLL